MPLVDRLQVDGDAAAVQRGVDAVGADERRQALDRRILEDDLRQFLLLLAMAAKEMDCEACEMP